MLYLTPSDMRRPRFPRPNVKPKSLLNTLVRRISESMSLVLGVELVVIHVEEVVVIAVVVILVMIKWHNGN